jgi:hypothetical protein
MNPFYVMILAKRDKLSRHAHTLHASHTSAGVVDSIKDKADRFLHPRKYWQPQRVRVATTFSFMRRQMPVRASKHETITSKRALTAVAVHHLLAALANNQSLKCS